MIAFKAKWRQFWCIHTRYKWECREVGHQTFCTCTNCGKVVG
uniref:Rubredoxin metal binding domain n=1 Tax=Podoviridae sp. ctnCN2 TaxID=2825274 RepID=A0A8S5PMB6_9CAUD|nr:MAG TPA: Rubredoxin metal binding domain [Podoviridae sp. ctnCN2]